MSKRITSLDDPDFGALFTGFKHTAYRLEKLQVYDVSYEEEPYRAFLEGRPEPSYPAKREWVAMIQDAAAAGKVMQRVHIVTEPLTDYLRYEMQSYASNADAGEDIRILPADEIPVDDVVRFASLPDYWLFDSSDLWVMQYDHYGKFLWAQQVTEPATIVRAMLWRDAALHYSVPYADYMRRRELLRAS